MKNVTVSVPDSVYRTARIRAAERGTSVSSLVAEFLRSLSERETALARSRAQWNEVLSEIEHFRVGDPPGRDQVHDRAVR